MMNLKRLLMIATMLLSVKSFAAQYEIKTLNDEGEILVDIARVQANFILKKPDANNNTRINLLVIDNGGSTDVSPTISLYLTFWKDGEMGDARSAFLLAPAFSLVDYTYKNGKLELKLKELGDKGFVVETMNIDFSAFAKKFEKEAESVEEEFGIEYVEGTIFTNHSPM